MAVKYKYVRAEGNVDNLRVLDTQRTYWGAFETEITKVLWNAWAEGTSFKTADLVVRPEQIQVVFHRNGEVTVKAPTAYWDALYRQVGANGTLTSVE